MTDARGGWNRDFLIITDTYHLKKLVSNVFWLRKDAFAMYSKSKLPPEEFFKVGSWEKNAPASLAIAKRVFEVDVNMIRDWP